MKESLKESHLKTNQQTNMMLLGQLSSAQGASDSGHCAHKHSSMAIVHINIQVWGHNIYGEVQI